MAEEICIDGSDVYTIFESGSTPYSCVDGNKCSNIVDRVCISQLDDWFYWTANNYQDEEEAVTPPEVTTPGMAYEPTSATDAKYLNTYVYADGAVKTMYNPYTASMALDMSNTAYKISTDDTWSTSMSKYGYSQIKRVENNGVYTLGSKVTEDGTVQNLGTSVNATVGLKKVIYNGQTKYCVAIAFRGTDMTDFADVITDINLIPNGNGIHSGFADVANDFTRDCDNIKFKIDGKTVTLAEMILDMKTEGSQYQILVTGHSLGGAVADVFVAQNLVKTNGVNPSNVVAYTFAAARSVSSSYSYNHHNIINIINADDIVPTIGGAKQIGDNIIFTPDDTFREANYGSNYVEDHTSAWWINAVDSAKTGFVAHKLKPVYNSIIKNIASNVTDYTTYNTVTDNTWSDSVTLNQNSFSKITGNLIATGEIIFNESSLEVIGSATIAKLDMTHDSDYFLTNGDLKITHGYDGESDHLTAGTVEIKGNFTECGMSWDSWHSYYNYCETGSHKTILSGVDTQTVSFKNYTSNNQFTNLILENTDINFATPIYQLTLCEDTTITNPQTLQVYYTLDLNGYVLTTTGAISAVSLKGNGTVTTNDKLSVTNGLVFSKNSITVNGNLSVKYIRMTNDDDKLDVNGNLSITGGDSSTSYLTKGTVYVSGDFTTSTSSYSYNESGTHITVLDGASKQTVTLGKPSSYEKFATLVLVNESDDGVIFESNISVTKLFNHNQNNFTLYNNGSGSTFVDYDGDGLKDNVDPYPTETAIQAADFVISPVEKQLYLGEEIKPTVIVSYNNKVLELNKDYTISYSDNDKPGTATITITGIDHYINSVTVEFEIYCNHNYDVTRVEPTCTKNGSETKVCSICGDRIFRSPHQEITVDGSLYPESNHNYSNNTDQYYDFGYDGAKQLILTFSSLTKTESGYDYIYIYDGDDNEIGKYDGTTLANQAITINGDSCKIRLTSDYSNTYYGFSLSSIIAIVGDENADDLLAKGHSYTKSYTNPTCTEYGYETYSCVNCDDAYTEFIDSACGHMYKLIEVTSYNELIYKCSECDYEEKISSDVVFAMWDTKYINKTPERTAKDDSCYLDVVSDGIINAKDYAKLYRMTKE